MYVVTVLGGHHSPLSPNDSSLNHSNFLFRRHTHTTSEDMKPKLSLGSAYFGLEMATLSHTSHCWNLRNNSAHVASFDNIFRSLSPSTQTASRWTGGCGMRQQRLQYQSTTYAESRFKNQHNYRTSDATSCIFCKYNTQYTKHPLRHFRTIKNLHKKIQKFHTKFNQQFSRLPQLSLSRTSSILLHTYHSENIPS